MKPTNPPPHRPGTPVPRAGHAAHVGHGSHHGAHDDNPEVAHEESDINVRRILMFGLGMAAITGAVAVLMYGMFIGLERWAASNDPQLSPLAVPAGQLPPEPRIITNEPAQLKKWRDEEARILAGGVDERTGTAVLPIEEAKKRLLQQGMPARPAAPAGLLLGTTAPVRGESSSGRMLGVDPARVRVPSGAPVKPAVDHKGH